MLLRGSLFRQFFWFTFKKFQRLFIGGEQRISLTYNNYKLAKIQEAFFLIATKPRVFFRNFRKFMIFFKFLCSSAATLLEFLQFWGPWAWQTNEWKSLCLIMDYDFIFYLQLLKILLSVFPTNFFEDILSFIIVWVFPCKSF